MTEVAPERWDSLVARTKRFSGADLKDVVERADAAKAVRPSTLEWLETDAD